MMMLAGSSLKGIPLLRWNRLGWGWGGAGDYAILFFGQDFTEAAQWLQIAANQGGRPGAVQPRDYVRDTGVLQDATEAARWFSAGLSTKVIHSASG